MIYFKAAMFLISLFFSGMFLDELIENIILFAKGQIVRRIFPVGLYVTSIVCWVGFYFLTLL
jgi:hypothetical protein